MKIETTPIAVPRSDGSVSILHFVTVGRGNALPNGAVWIDDGVWVRPATEALIADEVKRAVPDYVAWHRAENIPEDRTFRDALHHDGKKLVHDITKAREIVRRNIRHARAAAFPELDAKWMKATGQGNKKAADAVEAQRQVLRDAPADPRIAAARTVEELKQLLEG